MKLEIIPTKELIEKFMRNVTKGECWEWGKGDGNYGTFSISKNRTIGAHRVSYALFVGPVPDKMQVCHRCDNPSCVKPDHLFLGTQKDNMRDMRDKKSRGYSNPVLKGKKKHVILTLPEIHVEQIDKLAMFFEELPRRKAILMLIKRGLDNSPELKE